MDNHFNLKPKKQEQQNSIQLNIKDLILKKWDYTRPYPIVRHFSDINTLGDT